MNGGDIHDKTPRALTATRAAQLDASRADMPVSARFDDIYYSADDGLEETRNVYLKACGLPQRWQGCERYVIGELGFGSGLNFLATWQIWEQTRPCDTAHLHFVSVEGFPLSEEELRAALAPWGQLSDYSQKLITAWPGRVKGLHRIDFDGGVSLTLIHEDVDAALRALEFKADSWFLDGFSPAKNPDMWSEEVMQSVYDHSAQGASIGTFTVAGDVRRGLSRAGFTVSKQPGFGRKRERLEAVKESPVSPAPAIIAPDITAKTKDAPLIIGGGIAGASLARSFARRGITPVLIDPDDDSAASGNPAAIVKPRLDLQDRPESRFYLAAYLYALGAYAEVDGAIYHRGIAQSARNEEEMTRFEKLISQGVLPKAHLSLASASQIAARCGVQPKGDGMQGDGVWFGKALAIDPRKVTQGWSKGAQLCRARVSSLRHEGGLWQARNEAGDVIASSSHVYVTAGAGMSDLVPQLKDHLRYLGGQITWGEAGDNPLQTALVYGGYALRAAGQLITGATHDRLEGRKTYEILEASNIENVEGFTQAGGTAVITQGARSALRVTTRNTFPIIGQLVDEALKPTGLHVLTGLSGRGFSFAPLLADHLAALYSGTPPALTRAAHQRLWRDVKLEPSV